MYSSSFSMSSYANSSGRKTTKFTKVNRSNKQAKAISGISQDGKTFNITEVNATPQYETQRQYTVSSDYIYNLLSTPRIHTQHYNKYNQSHNCEGEYCNIKNIADNDYIEEDTDTITLHERPIRNNISHQPKKTTTTKAKKITTTKAKKTTTTKAKKTTTTKPKKSTKTVAKKTKQIKKTKKTIKVKK